MELEKIYSPGKRNDLEKILLDPKARHNQRQYFVGFLKYAGYTEKEICDIIHHINKWTDYDFSYTHYQVHHIFIGKASTFRESSQCVAQRATTLNDIIMSFLKDMSPVKLTVPSNFSDAVAYYSYMGFTVLPKAKGEKRPAIAWKEYTEKKPTSKDLMGWDFSNGICLLANEYYSFLDIDAPGYESVFQNWHKEKTPRGGLHVFGKGKIRSVNVDGGELKGIGSLIVSYPTEGYKL